MPTVQLKCLPLVARSQGLVKRRHVGPQGAGLQEEFAILRGPKNTGPESAPQYVKGLTQRVTSLLGARIRPEEFEELVSAVADVRRRERQVDQHARGLGPGEDRENLAAVLRIAESQVS